MQIIHARLIQDGMQQQQQDATFWRNDACDCYKAVESHRGRSGGVRYDSRESRNKPGICLSPTHSRYMNLGVVSFGGLKSV